MGAHVERRRPECRCAAGTEGVAFGRGCPLPNRAGVWGGAVPPPQNIFFNFLPRNGAFFEHSDTIRQFTRPVAIRLKPANADVRANAKCLLYSTKKTTFSRFVSFIKVILW